MSIIISLNKKGVFGVENQLAYTSKKDLNTFSTLTKSIGNVVMGINTWKSLPKKPLPDRLNIIISTNSSNEKKVYDNNENSKVIFVKSIESVFSIIEKPCFIGGLSILNSLFQNKYFNRIKKIYLTEFDDCEIPKNSLILKLPIENFKMQSKYSKIDTVKKYDNTEENMKISFITYSRIYSKEIDILSSQILNENTLVQNNLFDNTKSYELNYLNAMNEILKSPLKKCRNAYCHSKFGLQFKYDCSNNKVPFITTKKLAWKTCIKELLWFLKGSTNNKELKEQNVKIWNSNTTKEFLKSRNLNYKEDDAGPIYGFQWRHWNSSYTDCNTDYTNKGIDQLKKCEEMLKTDPNSRRIIMSTWNVEQLDEGCLPPCHILVQFYVSYDNKLYLHFYQRSADMFLGVPFNMASYAVFLHLMSQRVGIPAGGVIHSIGDAHIYENHVEAVKQQLKNEIKSQPKILIKSKKNWEDYKIEDFTVIDYECAEKISAKLVA